MCKLESLLSSSVPKPHKVGSPAAGLALGIHALLVQQGFNVAETPDMEGTRARCSPYMPPHDWQKSGPNEWNFIYFVEGKVNHFKLVVAYQEKTGRIFVHASEENNVNNIQVLGLMLGNYVVPDMSVLKTQDWDKILISENEQKLRDLVMTHIVKPLLATSEDLVLQDSPVRKQKRSKKGKRSEQGGNTTLYLGVVGLGILVACTTIYAMRRSQTTQLK